MKAEHSSLATVIGAMGVVYGDIGTSPLYTMESALSAAGPPLGRFAILGVLSWIFWSLALVVTLKYVVLIMRADNDGEGGILSLFALVQRTLAAGSRWLRVVIVLAALGAALFYCDTLITPAITVLSAVEGLENLNPQMIDAVVPVTLVIIIVLFAIQHRGTEKIGRLFGPVMLLWFVTLGVTGLIALLHNPAVLAALSPVYALVLLAHRPGMALAILGGVFLAVTGGEALYADMGQFGRRPVRIAWAVVVWPALVLNYFGQGARILADPRAAHLPVFQLVPASVLPLRRSNWCWPVSATHSSPSSHQRLVGWESVLGSERTRKRPCESKTSTAWVAACTMASRPSWPTARSSAVAPAMPGPSPSGHCRETRRCNRPRGASSTATSGRPGTRAYRERLSTATNR